MTTALVALTVDVDNDGIAGADERDTLTWRGVEQVEGLAAAFAAVSAPATWFLRADEHLEAVHGRVTWLWEKWRSLWQQLEVRGGQLAWHPHLYVRDATGRFVPDLDGDRGAAALKRIHKALVEAGWAPSAVRVGEAFHHGAMMRALDELGVPLDSTALPGRFRTDASRHFDWRDTPNAPYHPSVGDHRRPGSPAHRLLEVPMTTMPFRADYDPGPLLRYVNLAYRPDIFVAGVRAWLAAQPGNRAIVLTPIVHVDEVIATAHLRAGLYAGALETVRRNLAVLRDELSKAWTVRFVTLTALAREFA